MLSGVKHGKSITSVPGKLELNVSCLRKYLYIEDINFI